VTTDTRTADRVEIAGLFARLSHLLDERRWDDAHTVFHPGIVSRSPHADLTGLAEVTAHLKRSEVEGELTQHVNGAVDVRLDGDRAEAVTHSITYFFRAGEPPHRTGGLRLAGSAARTEAGWRLDTLDITLLWQREN
jgi:hypothetical protein